MWKRMESTTLSQISKIKAAVTSLLTFQGSRLGVVEKNTIMSIYSLMDDILLDQVNDTRHSVEDVVDTRIMEYSIILQNSQNTEVRRLRKMLEEGLTW